MSLPQVAESGSSRLVCALPVAGCVATRLLCKKEGQANPKKVVAGRSVQLGRGGAAFLNGARWVSALLTSNPIQIAEDFIFYI
jgi:hypothetical protein